MATAREATVGWLYRFVWSAAAAFVAVAASAQVVTVPNPSFEQGAQRPDNWTLAGTGGEWSEGDAADGRRAIAATGTGREHSFWHSDRLDLAPLTVYQLAFAARRRGEGGTPVSGPPLCNRDLGAIGPAWEEHRSIFITPRSMRPEDACLRFGQWHVRGKVEFDNIRLWRAIPVHARSGDLALGEGEALSGTVYTFNAPFRGESRNYSRPLEEFNCAFNTDRWCFGRDDYVIYRHELPGRQHTAGEVHVSTVWWSAGRLIVQASADRTTWHDLGVLEKVSSGTWKLPEAMLPAARLWVRLAARPDDSGRAASLQVGHYICRTNVSGPPARLTGRTRFAAVARAAVALNVEDLGEAVPGGRNVAVLTLDGDAGQAPLEATVETSLNGRKISSPPAPVAPASSRRTVRVPYELIGPGNNVVRLVVRPAGAADAGGVLFDATVAIAVADYHDSSWGQRLPSADDVAALWWCSSGWKVSRTRRPPEAAGEHVLIRAARNEAEAAQVVIRPARALRGLRAMAEDLRTSQGAVIAASNIDILRVRYVDIAQPTDRTGVAGPWPDPLPPATGAMDLEADTNQPLWIRVRVPRDAQAGVYTGALRLDADGYAQKVPLRVEVYDFVLPDRMTCTTAFGFSPENVWKYQRLEKPEDRRAVLEKYWQSFSSHHISPYDPAPLDRIRVTWPDRKTFVPVIDFTAWDAAMTRAIEHYRFNTFMVHIPGMGGGSFHARHEPELLGYREHAPEYKMAFGNYCRAMEAHLREKGWLDEAFIYWFDEPDPKDYEFVMNGFRKLKEAAPLINRMLTEQVEDALVGGPNIWCPITTEYNHDRAEQRRKAGEKFWWYICCGPKAPYATLFIDHPGTELRVWLWQTWQRKIDGILIWQTNYWTSNTAYPDRNRPQNPYEDPMSWVTGYGTPTGARVPWGNGDGRFIYPPESAADASPPGPVLEGPVESIRWEMLRDGIEDYEYLAMLRRLLNDKGAKLPPERRAAMTALLEVPPSITTDLTHFTKDPQPIETRRHEIALAIVELLRL